MDKTVLHIIIILFLIAGCSSNKKQESDENNSMQDMPEMKTEEMSGMNHQSDKSDTGFQNVLAPANKMIISNAQTIHPIVKNISDTIYAAGYIAFDERRNNKVAMRVAGRIEKLYLKYNYQYVYKGDKVLELYSPELNTYQEEFLHHLKTKSDSNLIDATKKKLKLLGLSVMQLNEIEASGQPLKSITIYSLYDGFILYDLPQQQNSSSQNASSVSSGMNGMNGGEGAQQSIAANQMQSGAKISEGDYVSKGQTLFVLNDCKEVYAIVAFDANEGAEIKPNLPVKIKSQLLPGETINASISFMEPSFKEGQKFLQARVYLKNESLNLKVNSIVSIEFAETGKYLVVPSSSVLSLGNRKFVWLKKESSQQGSKMLQAKEIKVGKETGGYMQVISGITAQDEIAKDAGYLLDSESLIKPE
ncbi:MAG: efflux RND transporter periplasmic adaptor subunit [Chitinophagales bacterium]|nr:efflux RND transporter periplasmic adaptor subunit [Chitinophagales bacterium]